MNNTQFIERLSQQIPVFSKFIEDLRASGLTAWLVGGCVRDLLLDKECADIDIVTIKDPSDWARNWAKGRGYWFWLDEELRQSRILLATGISFDFAPLRAATIAGDLQARDYTINAIALAVNDQGNLFDPLGGVADLNNRCLKVCSSHSFSDDPLRILKGIRHAATLKFTIDNQTVVAMIQLAQQLTQMAAERIREEFIKILEVRDISYPLDILSKTSVLQVLFGTPAASWSAENFAVIHQTIYDRFDDFSKRQHFAAGKLLKQQRPIFLLAALLILYASQRFKPISAGLRLSKAQHRLLNALRGDLPVSWLRQLDKLSSDRQFALAVEQLHPCGVERIFYHGLCRNQLDEEIVISLLTAYEQQQSNGRIPDLIDGHGMMHFTAADSRNIGELLRQVKALEIEGEIRNKEDALKWLQTHFGFDKN